MENSSNIKHLPWEQVLNALPQEYTSDPQLFNNEITENTPVDPSKKINLLLTQRGALFSEEGYLTKNQYGLQQRLWVRFHSDETEKVNGIVLCMITDNYFQAWKGVALAPRGEIQSVSWDENGFSYRESYGHGNFPTTIKDALFDDSDDTPEVIDLDIREISDEEKAKMREFFGASLFHLPSIVREKLFPGEQPPIPSENPSNKWLYMLGGGVVLVGICCFLAYRHFAGNPGPVAPGPEPVAPGPEPVAPGPEPVPPGPEPVAPESFARKFSYN